MVDKIIDIKHLSKSFGDKKVLEDINLYIRRGEFLTLLGPSGCGKTTLLRMIAGFLQPDEGSILMDGGELAGIPPHERPLNTVFQRYALFPHMDVYDNIAFGLKLKKVPEDEIDKRVRKVLKLVAMSDYEDRDVETLSGGQQQRIAIARAIINRPKVLPHERPLNTVFQRYALFPHMDVYDNIAFGLKLKKVPEDEIDKRVRKVLKLVAMSDYEDRDVETLSGGQQQRIAIARAIINRPKVLLLDEPLAALDLKMRKDMQTELKEMHKQLGITFIYVTHDQEEALTLSDTIVVLNEGRIQQIGTPVDIYNEPVNSFVADFIGESNILNGTMVEDRKVSFIGHTFDCVDEGFGENVPVDVVVRPEDIYFTTEDAKTQFTATVKSCTFKGVHYEMFVDTDSGNELMIQDYDAYPVGSTVQLYIDPDDIQVMHKERTCNTVRGEVVDNGTVELLGCRFDCPNDFESGTEVIAEIAFDKIDLMDDLEAGTLDGEVHFILYKGDHYHLTIRTDEGDFLYVDTNDIWDKGDLVGIRIAPEDIHIRKADESD